MRAEVMGRYIIADPNICHGEPTFRGTRILVADVLEQIANGIRLLQNRKLNGTRRREAR